jgi:hypothetical protein
MKNNKFFKLQYKLKNNKFFKLPHELQIKIYKFDNTYRIIFNNVLQDLIKKHNKKKLRNIINPHSFLIMFL